MSDFYTEADYENSVIELFQNMGYRYVYAPDLERDFRSPLYGEELEEAIHRINPDMPEQALADAIYKLKNFSIISLIILFFLMKSIYLNINLIFHQEKILKI